jgi:hypothetical protein
MAMSGISFLNSQAFIKKQKSHKVAPMTFKNEKAMGSN